MTLEMIGTQSIHPDYSNLHNIDCVQIIKHVTWAAARRFSMWVAHLSANGQLTLPP